MKKYRVMIIYSANETVDVEANSPEEAAEKATAKAFLCHQCSDDLYLEDESYRIVTDAETGDELYSTENLS